jgi:hypothetical protein
MPRFGMVMLRLDHVGSGMSGILLILAIDFISLPL